MRSMHISIPDALKSLVDEQVASRALATRSEYVRELIRKDQDRLHLYGSLLAGADSVSMAPADAAGFATLRERVSEHAGR